jgi:hypothetical protein
VTVDLVTTAGATVPPRRYRFDGVLPFFGPDQMVGVETADDSTQTGEHLQKEH